MLDDNMLSGYRVLDLTEGGCLISGQMLGDLGADVIKIEPPGGSPSRNNGPFYNDMVEPEKSLFWFAYNRNKRGITLNIESEDGREIFKRLVETADIILESYQPSFLDRLDIGYASLCKIKPDIIVTAITPFGSSGPKSNYKSTDFTTWAASVIHFISGDPDRPPVRLSWPSAGIHGGILSAFTSLFVFNCRTPTHPNDH